MEQVNVKRTFDIIFSNPPYNRNIDLKLLQELFSCSKYIIFIHPAGYILDKRFKHKLYNVIRNSNHLKYVHLFWNNNIFDIELFMPLCISYWDTRKNTGTCVIKNEIVSYTEYTEKINDILIHDNKYVTEFFSYLKEYLKVNDSLQDHITEETALTDYSVKIALIRGHIKDNSYNEDFFSLICKDEQVNYCNKEFRYGSHVHCKLHWGFNSELERKNFVAYCKTKFVRFCLSFYKINTHLDSGELEIIPWLDFTKLWTDKELCKVFHINKELWNYINNFIKDYYKDYENVKGFN